jgi:protein-S-isoprenylcysteine O-methyltransferase Ste14
VPESYLAWAARWRVPLGFLLAAGYFYFAQPTPQVLLAGAALAAVGIVLRALAAGYLQKGQGLSRSGPYAYVRHPLYLGSAFLVAGFALAAGRLWLAAVLAAFFAAVYLPVMLREEAEMRAGFPSEYAAYAAAVPRLLPSLRRPAGGGGGARFEWRLYWRNREYKALLGYVAALALLYLRMGFPR